MNQTSISGDANGVGRQVGALTKCLTESIAEVVQPATEIQRQVASIDRLWSVEEVSAYLGVPVKTLYQWKWRGAGPPVRKIGRHLRYDPAAVKRWVSSAA
jgi:excisionase family DNA binding protein